MKQVWKKIFLWKIYITRDCSASCIVLEVRWEIPFPQRHGEDYVKVPFSSWHFKRQQNELWQSYVSILGPFHGRRLYFTPARAPTQTLFQLYKWAHHRHQEMKSQRQMRREMKQDKNPGREVLVCLTIYSSNDSLIPSELFGIFLELPPSVDLW